MRLALRWLIFLLLLSLSIFVSVVATVVFHQPFLSLLLLFPFGPFFFRKKRRAAVRVRVCTYCDFWTTDPRDLFCPRDGASLKDEGPRTRT